MLCWIDEIMFEINWYILNMLLLKIRSNLVMDESIEIGKSDLEILF